MVCDTVLLGGGNAKLMKSLPNHVILGANTNAIDGGIKLWQNEPVTPKQKSVPAKSSKF